MKTVDAKEAQKIQERFLHGENCECVLIDPIDATTIRVELSVQDKTREYDWIDLVFEFYGVSDAKLLSDNQLKQIDTTEGFSINLDQNSVSFALDKYTNVKSSKDSPLYIIATTLKYEERAFSS